jgi:hypothetical protein
MSTRKELRGQSAPGEPQVPLHERIQRQREQLFKVSSMLDCCRYASASKLAYEDLEFMSHTLHGISALVNETAGELGVIVDELEVRTVRASRRAQQPRRQGRRILGRE